MKRQIVQIFGIAVVFLGLSTLATAQSSSVDTASTTSGDSASSANGIKHLMEGDASLVRPIDTKSAMRGENITAKLTSSIKTPQGIELPSGTELVGRVDQVMASTNDGPAKLVLTFDHAQLRDGMKYPVKATLVQVSPPNTPEMLTEAIGPEGAFEQMPGIDGHMTMQSAVRKRASGTFTDPHHNFKLDEGTELLVAVGVKQQGGAMAGAS